MTARQLIIIPFYVLLGIYISSCNNPVEKTDISDDIDTQKTISVDSFYFDEDEVSSDYTEYHHGAGPAYVLTYNQGYSDRFIRELQEMPTYSKYALKDSLIIADDTDTIYFPDVPKIGVQTVLTGKKDNLAIALTITRTNYTTLDYKIEMVEFGKSNYTKSGSADLNPGFILGSEVDESDKTGLGYMVTEFLDSDSSCFTTIRLGYEPETGNYLLGKLKKNCNGQIKDIGLDNFTNLVEK